MLSYSISPIGLQDVQELYRSALACMNAQGPVVWDGDYPLNALQADAEAGSLYGCYDSRVLMSAFALEDAHPWQDAVSWPDGARRPFYMSRLAVHPKFRRSAWGTRAVGEAIRLAQKRGADALRIFVADCNAPALGLYQKLGFRATGGMVSGRPLTQLAHTLPIPPLPARDPVGLTFTRTKLIDSSASIDYRCLLDGRDVGYFCLFRPSSDSPEFLCHLDKDALAPHALAEAMEDVFDFLRSEGYERLMVESEHMGVSAEEFGFRLEDWDNSGWYPRYYFYKDL